MNTENLHPLRFKLEDATIGEGESAFADHVEEGADLCGNLIGANVRPGFGQATLAWASRLAGPVFLGQAIASVLHRLRLQPAGEAQIGFHAWWLSVLSNPMNAGLVHADQRRQFPIGEIGASHGQTDTQAELRTVKDRAGKAFSAWIAEWAFFTTRADRNFHPLLSQNSDRATDGGEEDCPAKEGEGRYFGNAGGGHARVSAVAA